MLNANDVAASWRKTPSRQGLAAAAPGRLLGGQQGVGASAAGGVGPGQDDHGVHREHGGAAYPAVGIGADSLQSARMIRQPIETASDIANVFDGITYNKGAAVLRMFELWMRPDAFQKGVRLYLERHEHGHRRRPSAPRRTAAR